MYENLGLFQRLGFPRSEVPEVIDEFNEGLQYLASTKGSSFALVGALTALLYLRVFHCTFFSFSFFHFMVYWCGNYKAF